jgi:hypothetical protein
MDDADYRQVLESAGDLAALVDRRADLMTSRVEFAIRQYGAAALVRGCGLLRAAIASHRAGEDEAVGVLTRAILESWITGAFVLFGGPEALVRLDAERHRNEKNLVNANLIQAADLLAKRKATIDELAQTYGFRLNEDGEPTFGKLPVELMAMELGPLIRATTGDDEDPLALYNLMYRSYSTFDTHGLYPLERQLDLSELSLTTLREPTPWIDVSGSVGIACVLLAKLAFWVFRAYPIDTRLVEDIYATVADILKRSGIAAMERAPQQVTDALPLNAHWNGSRGDRPPNV